MKTFRVRALITLGPAAHDSRGRDYPSGTRAVMVRASSLARPARRKYFDAVIECDESEPFLHHGAREVVTITLTDDNAAEYLAAGQRFTLWNGEDIEAGVVSRQVFTTGSPS